MEYVQVFVYGSLRKGMRNHHTIGEAVCLAEKVTTPGELYDLGAFPAAKFGGTSSLVTGEVYEIPISTLTRLDYLEGMIDNNKKDSMYWRRKIPVVIQDVVKQVYAYEWNRSTTGLVPIECGDYKEYIKHYAD